MKVGLIGFGKTGKAVANTILQHPDFELEWVFRQSTLMEGRNVAEFLGIEKHVHTPIFSGLHTTLPELLNKQPVDVLIDFSSSQALYSYGKAAAEQKVKIISAVSHYQAGELDLLAELAKQTVVFWSPNITLGVNYLLFAGKFLKKIAPWVDVEIIEEHFKGKEGVSGTAIKIADSLEIDKSSINSIRAGGIVGKHEVIFGFPYQTVRLVHESISREAFGNGVLFVAQNLDQKPFGLYNFEDILLPLMHKE